jgi:hypothetical protein
MTDHELRSHFVDARDLLVKFIAEKSISDEVSTSHMQPAFELAAHFMSDPGLHSDNKTVADADKLILGTVRDFAKELLALKDAMGVVMGLLSKQTKQPGNVKDDEVSNAIFAVIREHSNCTRFAGKNQKTLEAESGGRGVWFRKMLDH